jgi:hypothetical protein
VWEFGVEDYKTTKTFTWIKDSKAEEYRIQGSIYRWLNPDIITSDFVTINFIFTDWKQMQAQANKDYPALPIMQRKYPLMSLMETEQYLMERTSLLTANLGKTEKDLPDCTHEELWQRASTFAYYKNPKSTTRATKIYDTADEAQSRVAADGNVGVVTHRPGKVNRCNYCNARGICHQAEQLEDLGLLT